MAQYAENNYFLSIDGTDLSSYITTISLNPTINEVMITAGSGTDHVQRAEGLDDHSGSFGIYHDAAAGYSKALLKGTHTLIIGLEGNAVGKPKHAQSCILSGIQFSTVVEKEMVVYTVTFNAADAPTSDMFAGATF